MPEPDQPVHQDGDSDAPVPRAADSDEQPQRLRRAVSPALLLFLSLGNMLGAGVYALTGEVAAKVGGAMWASLLLALTLACFTAGSYAELATKYPRAGGAATYVNRAFQIPFVTFLVAFSLIASAVNSAATLSVGVGGYLAELTGVSPVLAAACVVLVAGAVNARGISESARSNATLTIIEVLGILIIVAIGFVALLAGTGEPARAFEFKTDTSAPMAILAGAGIAFYSFIGFEDSVNVAEETREPSKTYPRVLFAALAIAGVLYLLVAFASAMVVPTGRLISSDGPLLEVVRVSQVGIPMVLFAVIALLAVGNGALINLLTASRLLYGMADQGILPSRLASIHRTRRTPMVAIVLATVVAFIFVFTGELAVLAGTTVVLLLAVFIMVNVSVLVLRRDQVGHQHFRVPTVLPVLGILVSLGLLTQQSGQVYVRVVALLGIGVVLWLANAVYLNRVRSGT